MKIAITGLTGFLGHYVAKKTLREGCSHPGAYTGQQQRLASRGLSEENYIS